MQLHAGGWRGWRKSCGGSAVKGLDCSLWGNGAWCRNETDFLAVMRLGVERVFAIRRHVSCRRSATPAPLSGGGGVRARDRPSPNTRRAIRFGANHLRGRGKNTRSFHRRAQGRLLDWLCRHPSANVEVSDCRRAMRADERVRAVGDMSACPHPPTRLRRAGPSRFLRERCKGHGCTCAPKP